MIRRKSSFGFIDFVRGKYDLCNIYHIQNSIDQMSDDEKLLILQNKDNFTKIWNSMECGYNSKEFLSSSRKFEKLKMGIFVNNKFYNLDMFFQESRTRWNDTEWEFPKGRKIGDECDQECAMREFAEETGFAVSDLDIVQNLEPVVESFIGSNLKPYQHIYFVATTRKKGASLNNFQVAEVSKVEWKTFDECMQFIRPYHTEKKELLRRVHLTLKSLQHVE